MRRLWKIALTMAAMAVCSFLAYGMVSAVLVKGVNSSEAAGWVQAVGSIIGIGIAIWVPYQQKVDAAIAAEAQRLDSANRVCLAFRDELALMAEGFTNRNATELLRVAPGEPFNRSIPISEHRYPIFNSMIARITEIDDERIRRGVIDAYETMSGLFELIELNNRILAEYQTLLRDRHVKALHALDGEIEWKGTVLASLREQMRDLLRTGIKRVNSALSLLNASVDARR